MLKKLTAILVLGFLTCGTLEAHGGQYRGPGDIVPPGGGRGPTTGRPSGPSGPGGPTTGRPGAPTAQPPRVPTGGPGSPTGQPGQGRPTTGVGYVPMVDLTGWQFWWEFNKDPFIRLRDEIHSDQPQTGDDNFYLGPTRKKGRNSLAPTHEDRLNILATLKRALDSTKDVDITTACLMAMAKTGMDHPDFKLMDVFKPYLRSNNQEVRETAALAIGIAAMNKSR